MITADTNPLVNSNSQTANSITVTCDAVGTYTIRMVGAPTTGGSYTVISATESVTVSAPLNHYTITADAGSYTVTGQTATVLKSNLLTANNGSYSVTGQDATIVWTPTATNYDIIADAGSYTLAGQAATIFYAQNFTITADAGSYTVSGQNATLLKSNVLTADAGSYTVNGQNATILKDSILSADAGSYTVNGQNATINYTPAGAYELTAEAGTYTVTGQDAVIDYTGGYTITAEPGSYVLTGKSASITYVGTAQAGGGIGKKSRKTRGWANEREQLQASLEVSKDFAPSPELVQAREVLAKAPNKIARKLARKVADYSGELGEYRTLEREYIKLQTQIEFNRQKTEAERKAMEVVRAFIKDEQEAVEVLMLIDDIDAEILSVGMM